MVGRLYDSRQMLRRNASRALVLKYCRIVLIYSYTLPAVDYTISELC